MKPTVIQAETKPSALDDMIETGYFQGEASKESKQQKIIALPKRDHNESDEICVYSNIENPCNLLKKVVNKSAILRDDSSIFKNIYFYDANEFNIPDGDNIEVVHHINKNKSTAKVMVRVTFPMHEEHDLIRTLQSQLEPNQYRAMLNMTKGNREDDLVLIAFVTCKFR